MVKEVGDNPEATGGKIMTKNKPEYKIGEVVYARTLGGVAEKKVKEIYINNFGVLYLLESIDLKDNFDSTWEDKDVYQLA